MLRGYRSLGIAALAAALLVAFGLGSYWTSLPYPQQRYQSYQDSKPDKGGTSPTVANVAGSIVERTPCNNPKSESESDLCAQWRAAKAAEKSADWTLYGVIASAVGISFLLWQIMLTREAVRDTGNATKAMIRQNEIAEQAQRPWVKISAQLLGVELIERRAISVDWQVDYTNVGGMVAECFQPLVKFVPMGRDFLEHMREIMDDFPGKLEEIDAVLIPNDTNTWGGMSGQAIEFLPWIEKEGLRKDCHLVLVAMCRYKFPGEPDWRHSMQCFAIAENISFVDNIAFTYDFPNDLSLENMHVRKLGRSRAT